MRGLLKGCGVIAVLVGLLFVALCVRFFDASSHQSTADCVAKMSASILRKTAALPSDADLRAKGARIEHILYGNESQARKLAELFGEKGWRTRVEPVDEIGWVAIIAEDPTAFRHRAATRVSQLCSIAEENDVRYRSWRLIAPGMGGYVAQN